MPWYSIPTELRNITSSKLNFCRIPTTSEFMTDAHYCSVNLSTMLIDNISLLPVSDIWAGHFFHGIALIINARETEMGIYLVFSLVSIIVLTLRVNKRGQYHFGILPRPASGNLWPQTKTKNMKITAPHKLLAERWKIP